MISYQQAQQLVLGRARSFGTERLALSKALGRVLAEPVLADRDYPPFNRATMDGYALKMADLDLGIRRFAVVETVYAGGVPTNKIYSGECYKIMTGAATPLDTDVIIRREDVEEVNVGVLDTMLVKEAAWKVFQNIARKGEDLKAGDGVLDRSLRCDPAVIGLLATLGCAELTVERLPRIALVTTGNEVVPVDAAVGEVQIRNSNRYLLEAALQKEGFPLTSAVHATDDPDVLQAAVGEALKNDIVIVCGGVSAGDADFVPAVLDSAGVIRLFHKMAIKPGKPTWCGYHPDGAMVFALPGNPFSCLVNMILLIRPYLYACSGLSVPEPIGLPLADGRKKKTPLDDFFPVILSGRPAQLQQVVINGSGDIRLGRQANGLALHPAASGDLPAGAEVLCYSFV